MPFQCSICGEESTRICVRCTKDACDNHLCDKCKKCSDCCECEVALSPHTPESVRDALHAEVVVQAVAEEEVIVAEVAPAPDEELPADVAAEAAVETPPTDPA